jgi:DNA invertase Pin-like site-specific DNA recombinase
LKNRAVIYARFSSHSQTEQSIEGQLRECYDFAKRNNYIVIDEYIDRALTGTTDKRPQFLQMIEDSKKENI